MHHIHRVILITGASSGIGEASVRRMLTRGWKVVLTARRKDRLEKLRAELDPTGEHTLCVAADITREADRIKVVADAIARFGRIDVLVNNAGYGQRGPLERIQVSDIRANFETNVFSLIALTQLVLPHFRSQGTGRIINIGSVAGKIARPLTSVYDSTKHALEALTDGLRGELKPFGFPVVLIRPGYIVTEFVDAANHASGQALADLGPYAPYFESHVSRAGALRKVAGVPDDIARLVELAATVKYPKSHYAGPRHAKLFLFLKWALPSFILEHLTRMAPVSRT